MNAKLQISNFSGESAHGEIGKIVPINISLEPGSISAIFQAKEASLFFRMLSGKGEVTSGSVKFGDNFLENLKKNSENQRKWHNTIGLAFRDRGLLANQTIYENVALPWKYFGELVSECMTPEQALNETGVDKKYWNERPYTVPWSLRKWALLARSIVLAPKLLFLDDPTVLLPFEDFSFLRTWIKNQANKGVIIIIGTDNTPFGLAVTNNVIDLNTSKIYLAKDAPLPETIKNLGNDMNKYLEENR